MFSRFRAAAWILIPGVVFCQAAPVTPRFDVASVRIFDSRPTNGDRTAIHSDSGRIDYHLIQMKNLVLRAWQVEDYQVVWPAGMGNQYAAYDVSATMPPGTTQEQFHLMLQGLLAERFKIAVHRETRETKVYALGVSPRGLKLHTADNPPVNEVFPHYRLDTSPGRSWRLRSKDPRTPEAPSGLSLSSLLSVLPKFDRALVDTTGIKGYYDIDLNVPLSPSLGPSPGPPADGSAGGGGDTSSVSPGSAQLFDALEKQVGLKAEAKTLPIEMLVIDHLERVPTDN